MTGSEDPLDVFHLLFSHCSGAASIRRVSADYCKIDERARNVLWVSYLYYEFSL
jgi:hypothetical protein